MTRSISLRPSCRDFSRWICRPSNLSNKRTRTCANIMTLAKRRSLYMPTTIYAKQSYVTKHCVLTMYVNELWTAAALPKKNFWKDLSGMLSANHPSPVMLSIRSRTSSPHPHPQPHPPPSFLSFRAVAKLYSRCIPTIERLRSPPCLSTKGPIVLSFVKPTTNRDSDEMHYPQHGELPANPTHKNLPDKSPLQISFPILPAKPPSRTSSPSSIPVKISPPIHSLPNTHIASLSLPRLISPPLAQPRHFYPSALPPPNPLSTYCIVNIPPSHHPPSSIPPPTSCQPLSRPPLHQLPVPRSRQPRPTSRI